MKETLLRQRDLIPLEVLGKQITMVGAGAVGSWTALALAKMGFLNLEVYDHDVVSIENMNCQFFPMSAIGKDKATVLAEMIHNFTNQRIKVYPAKYRGKHIMGDITISAVDSMEARKYIYEGCKTRWLIDPRMAAEKMLLYVIDMHNKEAHDSYAKSLYTDDQAVFERCTAKSTIYCANVLSGLVAKAVKDVATGSDHAIFTSYDMNAHCFTSFKETTK